MSAGGYLLIGWILGGLLGWLVGWLYARSRAAPSNDALIGELRQQLVQRDADLAKNQQELKRVTGECAAATEKNAAIPQLREDLRKKEDRQSVLEQEVTVLKTSRAELETTLSKEREAMREKLVLLGQAQEKLADAFKALSAEALRSNNQTFLELATTKLVQFQQSAQGDLEKRQQAIEQFILPVKESLTKFDSKLVDLEKARVGAYEGLSAQVKHLLEAQSHLRDETANLVKALGTPRVRGRWGEIQLKRVVEIAGMQEHCDFCEQQSVNSEEGRLRPDLIVKLPGGKNIVVDAKAPLAALLEALEAVDDKAREAKLVDHARQIRDHMGMLSRKAYWDQFDSVPEFVVLFLPGEHFFSAALERDPGLIEQGVEQRVILATPTTLITLLKAVAYGWRQEKLADNAQQISALGKELYDRITTLGEHFANLGASLATAVESYNSAIGCLETRVLVSARRFRSLKVSAADKDVPALEPVDKAPRQVQSKELVADKEPERLLAGF